MSKFISTIYGVNEMHDTPYRTKIQLPFGWRLHKFWRPDEDRAWHDHPNHFWTFPFASYDEEVFCHLPMPGGGEIIRNTVKAWRWHYRPALYTHRLIGRTSDPTKPHWTLVREVLPEFRPWGFYVQQPDNTYHFVPWRDYIFGGVRS